jgi:hypothetical protein
VSARRDVDRSERAIAFVAGDLAWYSGDEELRMRNRGGGEMALHAFLAPKFATG